MRVTFRADAALHIGTGHVMRCLALAADLAARGHQCSFISRDLPGNLIARTRAEGFATVALPPPGTGIGIADTPVHAAWAGVPWAQDAAETQANLPDATDWLVLDHYAFDASWTRAARPMGTRVMVLDDLADRPHDCDLLIDQTLGRSPADYDPLIPATTERLTGPAFAMLRPEFAAARAQALAKRDARGFGLRHLLIFMGGADLPDATGQILDHLRGFLPGAAHGIARITVLTGVHAPAAARVRAQAARMPVPCTVLSDVSNMADLMAEADLSIGAVGGTAWERCALGLPTLAVILAENQRDGATALAEAGAAILLGEVSDPALRANLHAALRALCAPDALRRMSQAAASITDGKGAARIIAAMETPFRLRPATPADAALVWTWRQDLPPSAFLSGAQPPLARHLDWFAAALRAPDRHLLMVQGAEGPFGHVRLDPGAEHGTATVSILLAPECRGKGLGLRVLAQLATWARAKGISRLEALIHPENPASLALFSAAGYAAVGNSGGFARMRIDTATPCNSGCPPSSERDRSVP